MTARLPLHTRHRQLGLHGQPASLPWQRSINGLPAVRIQPSIIRAIICGANLDDHIANGRSAAGLLAPVSVLLESDRRQLNAWLLQHIGLDLFLQQGYAIPASADTGR